MGEINTPRAEREAITAIDTKALYELVERAMRVGHASELRRQLWNCGPFIGRNLDAFERALQRDQQAKSSRKREETQNDLYRAASDIRWAVDQMQKRVEEELRDGERFTINDLIWLPQRLTAALNIRVSFSWRATPDDAWNHGSITFTHEVDLRPDYSIRPPTKRKPTKAQQERELQGRLNQAWDHLRRNALYSVRDFFKAGGNGAEIPKTFQAVVDTHTRGLNNHSTKFWRE
ncbi:hypothetical protein [Phenylobacterium aquaticum]|uniref:hypothetical protein n=1 Tax=Phenylobacterium aquaticum TaxID=1763816 RepID=UPI001F5CB0D8|nr:hypothetical protein [Phenylobacterium aquaticum]MCI3133145.1 hypothetical protein [Phenylobacterium aquaticum]